MNKKLISSLIACTLCVSNCSLVFAKDNNDKMVTCFESVGINSNFDKELDIEDYIVFKGDLLTLNDKIPEKEEKFMTKFINEINKLIKNDEIKVDKDTFRISKISNGRTKRDVEPGEWHQVGYVSYSQIQKLSYAFGISGSGPSIKSAYDFVRLVCKVGIAGVPAAVWIGLFVGGGGAAIIYNLKCACEDNNHNGAYILQYGDNNMYMPYKASHI